MPAHLRLPWEGGKVSPSLWEPWSSGTSTVWWCRPGRCRRRPCHSFDLGRRKKPSLWSGPQWGPEKTDKQKKAFSVAGLCKTLCTAAASLDWSSLETLLTLKINDPTVLFTKTENPQFWAEWNTSQGWTDGSLIRIAARKKTTALALFVGLVRSCHYLQGEMSELQL